VVEARSTVGRGAVNDWPKIGASIRPRPKVVQEVTMSNHKSPLSDRDAFMQSLALFDRPDGELRQRVLPGDLDVDAVLEAAFDQALTHTSLLPL
jgi:hypothetical protein